MNHHTTSIARSQSLDLLGRIDPAAYGRTRNHLDGAVIRLSPFLRHGILSLAEVRDAAISKAQTASNARKFIQELAWRDYYQRVWQHLGDEIWSDLEPYKTGYYPDDYAVDLPDDLLNAQTGIDYIDHFVSELHDTGYLHNHARMWLAAYVVHGRRVKWQAGARWFLSHLLDGDEASNNLSWQWCASTFSHKPYFFNRDNVLKYSDDRFAPHQLNDPFDSTYEVIAAKLFRLVIDNEPQRRFDFKIELMPMSAPRAIEVTQTVVWVHDGMMSPTHPAIAMGKSAFFVWDDSHIRSAGHTAKRIDFQRSALFCDDHHTGESTLAEAVLRLATAHGAITIVTGETSDPRLRQAIDQLKAAIDVIVVAPEPFVELTGRVDLQRFSRYWSKVEMRLMALGRKRQPSLWDQ